MTAPLNPLDEAFEAMLRDIGATIVDVTPADSAIRCPCGGTGIRRDERHACCDRCEIGDAVHSTPITFAGAQDHA